MSNTKHIIISFVAGVLVLAFAYHVYLVYQLRSVVAQHDAVLGQIVQLINNAQKQPVK